MMCGPPNLRQRMLPGRHSVCASWWISSSTDVRIPGTLQRAVCEWTRSTVGSPAAEMAQLDHRVGQGLEGIVHGTDDLVANTRSMVRKRSLKMAALNKRLGPRLVVFLARGFSLMLGTLSRLKIALRLALQS